MVTKISWPWPTAVILSLMLLSVASAELREWTDKTGKFKVSAEFVTMDGNRVVLRGADGQEIRVAIDRLSKKDRALLKAQHDGSEPQATAATTIDPKVAQAEIKNASMEFFQGLRSSDRRDVRRTLTEKAQEMNRGEHSPLEQLPKPAAGIRAIRANRAKLSGNMAEIPVLVRADGREHKTRLHVRYENEQWKIFAISAMYPEGEKSINFEAEVGTASDEDPLLAMVGKPMELAGYTIGGRPLDTSAFAGKVVLVDFWATWCGPCRAEIPNIMQNWQRYRDDGFDVIAISVDRDLSVLGEFATKNQLPWTVVADYDPRNQEKMSAKYGIRGIPAFFLVGRDGKVVDVNCRGPRLGQKLARLIGSRSSS